MRHATDVDHVVAVTAIVSDQSSLWRASSLGALWGIGHSVTILLVGGAMVVFRVVIPPRMGLAMEFAVALMLIALGAVNLTGRGARAAHSSARPVIVGFVHGLAGSAFVALLVVAAVPGVWLGLLYLALFGIGTVAGMGIITVAIAMPSALTAGKFVNVQRYLRMASGVASVAFGLMLMRNGIVDGLFSDAPRWNPH
jgi:hypothetical protein